jgi:four helix bundle protein
MPPLNRGRQEDIGSISSEFGVRSSGFEMVAITRFEDIKAWKAAREIVRDVYKLVDSTRLGKDFGLRDQMTRAGVSIMSNIAEGFGRHSSKDFARFLDLSRGSAAELQSLLYVAIDIGYVEQTVSTNLKKKLDDCIAMIAGLQRYLRSSNPKHQTPNLKPRTPNTELQTQKEKTNG